MRKPLHMSDFPPTLGRCCDVLGNPREAIVDKLFDPYCTTKPHGQGTGRGLSVVHRMVTRTSTVKVLGLFFGQTAGLRSAGH